MPGRIPRYKPPGPVHRFRPRPSADRVERKAILNSAAWLKLRRAILTDEPLCQDCQVRGIITVAAEVHHVIAMRKRPDLALDPDNLRALCSSCHSRRTARGE